MEKYMSTVFLKKYKKPKKFCRPRVALYFPAYTLVCCADVMHFRTYVLCLHVALTCCTYVLHYISALAIFNLRTVLYFLLF